MTRSSGDAGPPEMVRLFAGYRTLRGVIDAVLEGHLGRVAPGSGSGVARLDLGCYSIFGGDPALPAGPALVGSVRPPIELLVPDEQSWRDLLHSVHGGALVDRPMRTFSAHALDGEYLGAVASALPAGYAIERLDATLARGLDDGITPHALQVFDDPGDFACRGIGFGVLREGRLASAASSYAFSSRRVEVAISTRPDFRGQGLARAVAARMLRHCLGRGLVPEWCASNPVSKRLALSLGYRPGPLCDVFFLEGGQARP